MTVMLWLVAAYWAACILFVTFGYFAALVISPLWRLPHIPLARKYARFALPAKLPVAFCKEIVSSAVLFALAPLSPMAGGYYRRKDDRLRRAIVMVPGYCMTRTSWMIFARMLSRRGVSGAFHILNYNSLFGCIESSAHRLADFVDDVLQAEDVLVVDLVVHSQGAVVARWFLEKLGGSARVGRLIEVAGVNYGNDSIWWAIGCPRVDLAIGSYVMTAINPPPAGAAYTAIWSPCDEIIVPQVFAKLDPDSEQGSGAAIWDDVRIDGIGHLSILLSGKAADIAAERLNRPGSSM